MARRRDRAREARDEYSSRAFTLIELVAVIVVLAVLAGVAAPTLNSLASSRDTAAATMLLRDLTGARQMAIATGVRSWVVFDTAAESWSVLREDPSNPGRANASAYTDPATGADFVQTIGADEYSGVAIVSASFDGGPEVGFDWLGRPLNSSENSLVAGGNVVLTGGHTLTVEEGSGHVTHVAP